MREIEKITNKQFSTFFNFFNFCLFSHQAFVQFCVQVMDTTVVVCVIVKRVGKDPIVMYQLLSVKCLVVQDMVVVLKENVIVKEDGKDFFANNVSLTFL